MHTNANFLNRAEVEISSDGRALFAPEDCQRLNLTPGMTLTVGERKEEGQTNGNESLGTKTATKGHAVVFHGELVGDYRDIVDQLREERNEQNMRLQR